MAGLTRSGFEAETLADVQTRIKARLETYNPGFDFSPESPDGQLIDIFSFEIYTCWQQLQKVYDSYNPQVADGAGLRNLGLLTGIEYGVAERSQAVLVTTGTAGTIIPAGSLVSDADGNQFSVVYETAVPSSITVLALEAGPIAVPVGSITTIDTAIAGWSTVSQPTAGTEGSAAQTEQQFRTERQATVMRNSTGQTGSMEARLLEMGIGSVLVVNNDTTGTVNGIPAQTINVQLGDIPDDVTDVDIGNAILAEKPMGCPTYGTTSTTAVDDQGVLHLVSFTKATAIAIEMEITVEFLSENIAGAEENIKQALVEHIGGLQTGEDVIWSRLYGVITPYAKAQVDVLLIDVLAGTPAAANIVIADGSYATLSVDDIALTVV